MSIHDTFGSISYFLKAIPLKSLKALSIGYKTNLSQKSRSFGLTMAVSSRIRSLVNCAIL